MKASRIMTTEEPNYGSNTPSLHGPTETGDTRRSPTQRSQPQRSLSQASDCARPVLCLGETGQASGAGRSAKQPGKTQATRPTRNPAPGGSASESRSGGIDDR